VRRLDLPPGVCGRCSKSVQGRPPVGGVRAHHPDRFFSADRSPSAAAAPSPCSAAAQLRIATIRILRLPALSSFETAQGVMLRAGSDDSDVQLSEKHSRPPSPRNSSGLQSGGALELNSGGSRESDRRPNQTRAEECAMQPFYGPVRRDRRLAIGGCGEVTWSRISRRRFSSLKISLRKDNISLSGSSAASTATDSVSVIDRPFSLCPRPHSGTLILVRFLLRPTGPAWHLPTAEAGFAPSVASRGVIG
jgi:hypothetical protein